MTMLIRSHITSFPSNTKTMVVMADLDEIPASHSINLLKNCDFGSSIHLQLRDYLYRFVHPFCTFKKFKVNGTVLKL
jgi:beta-1,4-mannosyl-glycoprotein beta-1,4-N-acetylglucosaminyltransferase